MWRQPRVLACQSVKAFTIGPRMSTFVMDNWSMTCGSRTSLFVNRFGLHPCAEDLLLPPPVRSSAAPISRRRCRRPRGGPSTASASSSQSSSWRPRSFFSTRGPPLQRSSHSPPPGTRLVPRMLRDPSRTFWNLTSGFEQGAVASGRAGHLGAATVGGVAALRLVADGDAR